MGGIYMAWQSGPRNCVVQCKKPTYSAVQDPISLCTPNTLQQNIATAITDGRHVESPAIFPMADEQHENGMIMLNGKMGGGLILVR